jgi:hypothetical protein
MTDEAIEKLLEGLGLVERVEPDSWLVYGVAGNIVHLVKARSATFDHELALVVSVEKVVGEIRLKQEGMEEAIRRLVGSPSCC